MKVLLVNGSGHAKGCTYTALEEVAGALEKNGIETEIIQVGTQPIAGCIGCNACTKACTQNLNVMQYIAYAQRGEYAKCAEESFDCVMCGCCSSRCPAGISHPQVAMLARRLNGKYIEPECKHLKERVEEIAEGKCEEAIRANMALSDAEIREMYNNREIEK